MEQLEQISPAENRSSSWYQSKWSWKEHRGDFSSSMLLYKRVASTIDAPQSPVPTRPANHQLVNVHLWIVSAISANDAMGPWWDSVAPCYRLWHRERILRSKFRPEPLIFYSIYRPRFHCLWGRVWDDQWHQTPSIPPAAPYVPSWVPRVECS